MAVKITMPQLSQTTDEVILMRWLVQEGDEVKKGDALLLIYAFPVMHINLGSP